ncbi:MAG: hypothetical protein QOE96_3521 [Blastocatellia bacterium]|nr:hypothetical protein [Blastocatellia bacterium]
MKVEVCQLADRETCRNAFVGMRGPSTADFPPGWHFGEPQLLFSVAVVFHNETGTSLPGHVGPSPLHEYTHPET